MVDVQNMVKRFRVISLYCHCFVNADILCKWRACEQSWIKLLQQKGPPGSASIAWIIHNWRKSNSTDSSTRRKFFRLRLRKSVATATLTPPIRHDLLSTVSRSSAMVEMAAQCCTSQISAFAIFITNLWEYQAHQWKASLQFVCTYSHRFRDIVN